MKENVGKVDRIIRTVLGTGLVGVGITLIGERPVLGVLVALGGAFALESAVTRVCPVNAALGIDTRSEAEQLRDASVATNTPLIMHGKRASA